MTSLITIITVTVPPAVAVSLSSRTLHVAGRLRLRLQGDGRGRAGGQGYTPYLAAAVNGQGGRRAVRRIVADSLYLYCLARCEA